MALTLPIDMGDRNWAISTAGETLSALQPVSPEAIVVQIELRSGEEAARVVGALIPVEQDEVA